MADTTMFAAIDALVALITALPECANTSDVQVSDGFPSDLAPATVVAIGGTAKPTVTMISTVVTLGSQRVEEEYEVEGTISSFDGGTDQKTARDAAKGVYEAIQAGIRAQMVPGGNRLGVPGLWWAEMRAIDLKQTDESDAPNGRSATLTFRVACRARI